jgi:UDP-glucuronate decarboxylase
VDDLVDGLVRLMNSEDSVTGPVNIGNPVEFTMLELARQVIEKTKSTEQLEYSELPVDDPKQRQPEISMAREMLGWEPKVSLSDGLEATIAYFRSLLGEPAQRGHQTGSSNGCKDPCHHQRIIFR